MRPVKAVGRVLALLLALGALGAGCTRQPSGGKGSAAPTATGATPSSVVSSVPAGEGVYVYQNAGLTATLELKGNTGTLSIDNQTGRELAPPAFYLLDARDGRRVDGRVDGATSTPDGQTTEFDVAYSGLELKNIGLAVLLIGPDNYGAFVRQ
jgi:hypothetical protein